MYMALYTPENSIETSAIFCAVSILRLQILNEGSYPEPKDDGGPMHPVRKPRIARLLG
jgi:hypothetical protein